MSNNQKDLTGMQFGTLTVLGRARGRKSENKMWLCKCDCGHKDCKGEVVMRQGNLTRKTDWKMTCGAHGNNANQSAKTKLANGTVQKNSRTGVSGVNHSVKYPGRYRARICLRNGKRLNADNLSFDEAVTQRRAWEAMKMVTECAVC